MDCIPPKKRESGAMSKTDDKRKGELIKRLEEAGLADLTVMCETPALLKSTLQGFARQSTEDLRRFCEGDEGKFKKQLETAKEAGRILADFPDIFRANNIGGSATPLEGIKFLIAQAKMGE